MQQLLGTLDAIDAVCLDGPKMIVKAFASRFSIRSLPWGIERQRVIRKEQFMREAELLRV